MGSHVLEGAMRVAVIEDGLHCCIDVEEEVVPDVLFEADDAFDDDEEALEDVDATGDGIGDAEALLADDVDDDDGDDDDDDEEDERDSLFNDNVGVSNDSRSPLCLSWIGVPYFSSYNCCCPNNPFSSYTRLRSSSCFCPYSC